MADREFTYMIEFIPITLRGEFVEAYLQKAGALGWDLVSVAPAPGGVERFIFKLEIGSAKGTRPEKTW